MRFPFDDDDGKLHPAHVIQRPHKGLVRGQTTACFHISVARSYYNIISRIFLLMIALSTGNDQATKKNFAVNFWQIRGNACVRYPELIWGVCG